MSHIHIPDGVLPVWLWASGWAVALVAVALASRWSGRTDVRRKVPLLGAVSALMLVAMSSEVVPIAYHVNLTVIGGILLGPALSVVAAFIVEVVLAMLGHGGVTVIGLNTVVIGAEMILGLALFRGGVALFGRRRPALVAGVATVIALAMSTTMLVGIVAVAGGGEAAHRESGALDPASLEFASPFSEGVVTLGLFSGGEEHAEEEGAEEEGAEEGADSAARFAAVVYTLGPIGWLIEALVVGAVVGYVARVRPALLWGGALAEDRRVIPGDAQGGH